MRKLLIVGCLLMSLAMACSQGELPKESAVPPGESNELVVVSTNDFHAALDRAEGLASVVRNLKKRYGDRMIYLDAGDEFQGSLEGSISKGKAVIEFFNLLRPDAMSIGNHEFDYGPVASSRVSVQPGEDGMGNLKVRAEEAKYPMLSANLILDPPVTCEPGPKCNALGQQTVFPARAEIERNGSKVCVIGVTTPLTRNITSPSFLKGTTFLELKPVVQAEAARFRDKEHCDWVLLLAHEGLRYESDGKTLKHNGLMPLLEELPASTLDAVIGGHSHTPMQKVINGTPVIQTGKSARNVGVLHLFKNGTNVTHRFDPLIAVPDTGVAFDVTSALMFYRNQSLKFKRRIVGTTTSPFLLDKAQESALGNLVADAFRSGHNGTADCSVINAGTIRSNLPSGRISNEILFRLMPFDDTFVVADMTAPELRSLIEVACSGALGLCSISGLQIKRLDVAMDQPGPWDRDLNGDGKKEEWERNLILDVRDAKGKPLEQGRTYRVATSSYLVEGGDFQDIVYDRIAPSRIHYYVDTDVRDVLQEYFEKKSPLDPARFYSMGHPRIVNQATQ